MANDPELGENRQTESHDGDGIDFSGLTADQLLSSLPKETLDAVLDKIPLDRIPRYKGAKSKMDSNYESLRQSYSALEQQLRANREEMKKVVTSRMSDQERLQFERDELARELDDYRNRERQREEDDAKNSILGEIMESLNVPRDAVRDAKSTHEAWLMASKWVRENGSAQDNRDMREARAEEERKASNSTFTGSPSAPVSALQAKYDKARKLYEMKGVLEAMAEADRAGVELNEW